MDENLGGGAAAAANGIKTKSTPPPLHHFIQQQQHQQQQQQLHHQQQQQQLHQQQQQQQLQQQQQQLQQIHQQRKKHLQQQQQIQQAQQQQQQTLQQYKQRQLQLQHYTSAVAAVAAGTAGGENKVPANLPSPTTAPSPSKLQQSLQQQQQQQQQQQHSSSSSSSSTSSLSSLSSATFNVHASGGGTTMVTIMPQYTETADHRSDSGLSSSRTFNSSDERSGSHSSAFSGSDDHVAGTSPINEHHPATTVGQPSYSNNSGPVWREPNIMMQSTDGPIRHVGSAQHQSLYMSNTAPMPQVMLPYQSFQPPTVMPPSSMPPLQGAGGMAWKPPATVATGGSTSRPNNYYQLPNEQQQAKLNRGNTEDDVFRMAKKAQQQSYLQLPQTKSGKRINVPVENVSNEYGPVEIERVMNYRHQKADLDHSEKQHAEAAVHQHFEESFKLAQQQKRTNWITNLPTPPKNVFPTQELKTQDALNQNSSSLQMTNNRGTDEWKDKKSTYASPRMATVGPPSFSRPPTQQTSYRTQAVPKLNYAPTSILGNGNEVGNNIMISYSPYMNSNSPYAPSNSSVIVKNEGSSKSASLAPEAYAANRTPTILTVPAIKIDNNAEQKQAKPMIFSRSVPSSVTTSQIKGHDTSQEPTYPGPLLNTHGRYALYPPYQPPNQTENASVSPVLAQREETPPPAHLNATMTSVLPKFTPAAVSEDDFQTEPLDLVMMYNTKTSNTVGMHETNVPLQLYTGNNNAEPDPQEATNKRSSNNFAKAEQLNNIETSLPQNTFNSSPGMMTAIFSTTKSMDISIPFNKAVTITSANPITIPITISSAVSVTNSTTNPNSIPYSVPIINSKTIPTAILSSSLASYPKNIVATVSNNISPTIPTEIPAITTADIQTKVLTPSSLNIIPATVSTMTPTTPTTSFMNQDSSPSTPPPVLVPEIRTEITYSMKTHHHKLKKAWLQRHEWAEDLKEAGVNIDQSSSITFSQLDDTPPVLKRQITKKRKQTKSISENNVNSKTTAEKLQNDSDAEPRSSNNGPKKYKKRKMSNSTGSDNKDTTESDKDCNSSAKKKVSAIKIPKKRGRKPKLVVSIPLKKGKNKDGEIRFFQSGPCINAGPKIHKCRECRIFISKKKKGNTTQDEIDNIFCRFYAFRRLFTNKNGQLVNAGFPNPFNDVTVEDLNLWMPNSKFPPSMLDVDVAKKILEEAGRQFCYLVKEENKALNLSPYFKDKPIAWKKAANGVREMCDVCLTTIFNYHWACAKCGFGVCIDCVKARLNGTAVSPNAAKMTKKDLREKDTFMWMTCNSKTNHEVEQLMLTQIVAGDSMTLVFKHLHSVSTLWNILLECGCPDHPFPESQEGSNSDDDDGKEEKPSTDLGGASGSAEGSKNTCDQNDRVAEQQQAGTSDGRRASTSSDTSKRDKMKHFVRKKNKYLKTIPREPLPPRVMTLAESREFFPDNPHVWLCDGKLLRLLDPEDPTNCDIFQEQWKRGQPVMVSDVGKSLNPCLWSPSSFCRDFGRYTNDLVDCATGMVVEGKTMKQFWDGFEDESKRLKDSDGRKMLLKLKDWPVAADFSETLPERFADLMRALPLKDYTLRDGKLNLASRLPACFVRPDLGPKMYSAYGNAGNRDPGEKLLSTTNLHLDVSDAVNVMVFVAVTQKGDNENDRDEADYDWHIKEAYRAVDEAGCDMASRRRAREPKELPGAVWHIYHARDADSIRDLLNKVSAERGEPLEPNHDPIHDQSSYLDAELRARLFNEYGVQGYAVLQCFGDAIFIPAGAPHQVRNLHNCIKVAEDFVSPENVSQCFRLMNEFRDLSSNHSNHEDKLQIKNIMYHAVKDSLSVLLHDRLGQPN